MRVAASSDASSRIKRGVQVEGAADADAGADAAAM
jgi:hypothetical protein